MKAANEFINSKRILVFNPSFIGDSILTTPLIVALEKLFPDAVIDFCVRPESAPLFNGRFNTVVFDKRGKYKGLLGIFKFAADLKGKYDFAISLHKSFRTTLLFYLSKIPVLDSKRVRYRLYIKKLSPEI